MRINLYFFLDDLNEFHFNGNILDKPTEAACLYPEICEQLPEVLRPEVLYLIDAVNLESVPSPTMMNYAARSKVRPSIACCGAPPKAWLGANINIVYSTQVQSLASLANIAIGLFTRYSSWEAQLQEAVAKHLPLSELARRTVNLVGNPLYAQSSSYQIMFFELPDDQPNSATFAEYLRDIYEPTQSAGDPFLPDEAISWMNADPEYRKASEATEATIYSGEPFGFRSLFVNCRIGNAPVARITFDEVAKPLANRDFRIIEVLASYIEQTWDNRNMNLLDIPKSFQFVMECLLSHRLVPLEKLELSLDEIGWDMFDEYVLFILQSGMRLESYELAITQFSLNLARAHAHLYFLPFDNRSVFVCNLTKEDCTRDDLIASLTPTLRDQLSKASFSASFFDFKDLYYFYRQALAIESVGMQSNPMFWIFRYEDYAMDYILDRCLHGTIPSVLYPHGLMKLIIHDYKKRTNYVHILRLFLDLDRNIAQTARAAFLHRNTLLYQLDRIREILKMDLDDPNNRIVLQIALRIYDNEISSPSEQRWEYKPEKR